MNIEHFSPFPYASHLLLFISSIKKKATRAHSGLDRCFAVNKMLEKFSKNIKIYLIW